MWTYEKIISTPMPVINKLDEEEISHIINTVIDHYYENGFPYYKIDQTKIAKDYQYLKDFDVARLELDDNHLQQNMQGLGTVNAFHPEMWSTVCNKAKTPMDIFKDRDLFFIALRKRIKYSDTKLQPFNIRKSLKAFGAQGVSNFRPTIAKWAYERYGKGGHVLDPSMGYGGRLFGALCSSVKSYTSTDPNHAAVRNNHKLFNAVYEITEDRLPEVNTYYVPFEDLWTDKKFDFVFTSPPYFDIEKYQDYGDTQSYKRYPQYDLWRDKFLRVLIENSYDYLVSGGHMALNVGKPIDQDTFDIGTKVFGNPPVVYHMRLSRILGGKSGSRGHKTEPIFVWEKKNL